LVFVGRNDGDLTALDSNTGDQLWSFQTGAGVNAPATTFEHKGKQKVVVYSAGNLFAGTPPGDSVWLFSLDGKMGPGSAPGSASIPSVDLEQANIEQGKTVFSTYCSQCHGKDGGGSHGVGPDIRAITSADVVAFTATEGKGKMPPFKEVLSSAQLRDVAVYVARKLDK
jgi:mono/diheme cytochrome c family protein